ncbi:helix-turn-helix domain-containing protein [Pelagicoccus sp. SDUM812005]|uniref:TetR/AcrR family transcriptional regulator n=1 Tax=Pelagicoccus sp. SDUM812005 TaxID=3041257 RepID=UPI00280D27F5|nr:helix-turn-helix domain-containing protein [Pelagicoccus sp. SDUM812005]MDQ8180776.1 helix-turn-helix domain containing protein [Pelagicoccus sp. SDUM812005]
MKSSDKESPRSPERAEAQRNRILDAAQSCFIQHGFHAASMARVAETAGISQGLAYRYFKSKSAIILAIIERQLSERHTLTEDSDTVEDYISKLLELIQEWGKDGSTKMNPVLFIEMCAEATRDPDIQAALARADTLYREEFTKWITLIARKSGTTVSEEEINKRFFALQCLVEGSAMLTTRQEQNATRNDYLLSFLRQIVSP